MQAASDPLETFATYAGIIGNLATAVAALGIVLAAAGLRYQLQAAHRVYEDTFGQRYHAMRHRWPEDLRTKPKLTPEDRKLIRDYIHLASSECEARALGRVTDSTWNVWRSAIRHELFRSPADNFFAVYRDSVSSPENDQKYRPLQDLLATEEDEERNPYRSAMRYDPNTTPRLRRWLSGL